MVEIGRRRPSDRLELVFYLQPGSRVSTEAHVDGEFYGLASIGVRDTSEKGLNVFMDDVAERCKRLKHYDHLLHLI